MLDISKFIAMCQGCAWLFAQGPVRADEKYLDRVARLLFMTAAHESDLFRARRQYGFEPTSLRGAFSLFQIEKASFELSLKWIIAHREFHEGINQFQKNWSGIDIDVPKMSIEQILSAVQEPTGDALACIFARLHYLRAPGKVPVSAIGMAEYAKKVFNTELGKATPLEYAACAFDALWQGRAML